MRPLSARSRAAVSAGLLRNIVGSSPVLLSPSSLATRAGAVKAVAGAPCAFLNNRPTRHAASDVSQPGSAVQVVDSVLANKGAEKNELWRLKASSVLGHDSISVTRSFEWANIIAGFEQANKYTLHNTSGEVVGYLAEEGGVGRAVGRQLLRTRRNFQATVLNPEGEVVLVIKRPVFLVSSSIYDLIAKGEQFARIDQPMLSWDFVLADESGGVRGGINKNWRGFGTELFTDAGQYVVHFTGATEGMQPFQDQHQDGTKLGSSALVPARDAAMALGEPLGVIERATALACAITIDNDYFSQHSRGGGGWMPWLIPMPSPIPPETPEVPPDGAPSGDAPPSGPAGDGAGGSTSSDEVLVDDGWGGDQPIEFGGAEEGFETPSQDDWDSSGTHGGTNEFGDEGWGDDSSSVEGGGVSDGWSFSDAAEDGGEEAGGVLESAWDAISDLFDN